MLVVLAVLALLVTFAPFRAAATRTAPAQPRSPARRIQASTDHGGFRPVIIITIERRLTLHEPLSPILYLLYCMAAIPLSVIIVGREIVSTWTSKSKRPWSVCANGSNKSGGVFDLPGKEAQIAELEAASTAPD